MRPVALAVPALAAAVLFTGAACSASADPTAAHPSAPATTAPATTAPATTAPAAGGGTETATKTTVKVKTGSSAKSTATRVCRTADLAATATFQPERTAGPTRMALVTLTNASHHTCVVDGWSSISLVNPADEVVGVRTTNVRQPGAPVRTTLKPGRTAWAGIKWTACDKSDVSCGVGNTLRFSLEASTDGNVVRLDGFPHPEADGITMKNLQIGSLQPSSEGVVAW